MAGKASPRPWRVNQEYLDWDDNGASPTPILDAQGEAVIHASEWVHISEDVLRLIVEAVNAHPETGESTP